MKRRRRLQQADNKLSGVRSESGSGGMERRLDMGHSETRGGSGTPPHLNKVLGDITAGDVEACRQVGQGKSLVYGNNMGHAVARVNDNTSEQTCGYPQWMGRGVIRQEAWRTHVSTKIGASQREVGGPVTARERITHNMVRQCTITFRPGGQ